MATHSQTKKVKKNPKVRSRKPRVEISEKPCSECEGKGFKELNAGLIQKECPICLGTGQTIVVKDSEGHIITGKERTKIIREIVKSV